MFATDGMLGVRPSESYRFMIFTCPVGLYYNKPLRVRFEEKYVRSAEGGAGFAKNAGNYGAAMYPTKLAQQEGYNQLIWTDASEHHYVEESGTMNAIFIIDGRLVTPALSTSILDGITRRSVLQLARDWGMAVEERKVSALEILEAQADGTLQEAFGVGTAATIAPIAVIGYQGDDYTPADTRGRCLLPPRFGRSVRPSATARLPTPTVGWCTYNAVPSLATTRQMSRSPWLASFAGYFLATFDLSRSSFPATRRTAAA